MCSQEETFKELYKHLKSERVRERHNGARKNNIKFSDETPMYTIFQHENMYRSYIHRNILKENKKEDSV